MPAPNRFIVSDSASPAEVMARMRELGPDERLEVTIRNTRTRKEIIADMIELSRSIEARFKAEGVTDDDIADMLDMDQDERRNLLGNHK